MVYDSACTPEEIKNISSLMQSALHNYERKTDLMGSWCTNIFANWGMHHHTTDHFGLKNVLVDANPNLTNPQKELLL